VADALAGRDPEPALVDIDAIVSPHQQFTGFLFRAAIKCCMNNQEQGELV